MIAALAAPMIMNAIPQIMSLFDNSGKKAYKQVDRALNQGNKFAAAAADPTSKMYQAAKAEAESPLRRQAINAADEMFKLSRRAQARGYGSTMVNPERRDEARSKALMSAFEQASMIGGQQARERLQGAANSFYNYAQPAMQLSDRYRAESVAKNQTMQNLFSMGGALGGAAINQFAPNADQDIASFFKNIPSMVSSLFSGPTTVSK